MKEVGLDPSLVDVLERFGLVTPEQADANLEAWIADSEAYEEAFEDLRKQAKEAWEKLPLRERLFKSGFWWQMRWRDERRSADRRAEDLIRAAVRREQKEETL